MRISSVTATTSGCPRSTIPFSFSSARGRRCMSARPRSSMRRRRSSAGHGGVDFERFATHVAARLHLMPRDRQKVAYVPLEGRAVWSTTRASTSPTICATRACPSRSTAATQAPVCAHHVAGALLRETAVGDVDRRGPGGRPDGDDQQGASLHDRRHLRPRLACATTHCRTSTSSSARSRPHSPSCREPPVRSRPPAVRSRGRSHGRRVVLRGRRAGHSADATEVKQPRPAKRVRARGAARTVRTVRRRAKDGT